MQPRALLLALLLLALVAISGMWLWDRLIRSVAPSASPAATATVSPAAPPTAAGAGAGSPTPQPDAAGYRLAGVAVGDPDSFAVIEAPDGSTGLYRLNDDVPGLGELARIEAERVVISGSSRSFELQLAPAATPTPTAVRTPRPHAATTKPQPRAPGGGTTRAPAP